METMGTMTMPTRSDLAPPPDFMALKALIVERKESLPKRLRQIAAYSLENPDEIAFGTVATIAASADVQPSALVRFSQALGFEGFSGLQELFRARLLERNAGYEERLRAVRDAERDGRESVLSGFVSAAHRSLDKLTASVDEERFTRAAAMLANAGTIYIIAKRRSYPIGAYMAYAFGKMRIRCVLASTTQGIDEDILSLAGPGDAAFAISFSPYASESVAQARGLAARGVPLVSLTDTVFSPLAEISTEWFELAEADHAGFRLLSASMAFAMALTVMVAEHRRDPTK